MLGHSAELLEPKQATKQIDKKKQISVTASANHLGELAGGTHNKQQLQPQKPKAGLDASPFSGSRKVSQFPT